MRKFDEFMGGIPTPLRGVKFCLVVEHADSDATTVVVRLNGVSKVQAA